MYVVEYRMPMRFLEPWRWVEAQSTNPSATHNPYWGCRIVQYTWRCAITQSVLSLINKTSGLSGCYCMMESFRTYSNKTAQPIDISTVITLVLWTLKYPYNKGGLEKNTDYINISWFSKYKSEKVVNSYWYKW